jgi:hypothetical protein
MKADLLAVSCQLLTDQTRIDMLDDASATLIGATTHSIYSPCPSTGIRILLWLTISEAPAEWQSWPEIRIDFRGTSARG